MAISYLRVKAGEATENPTMKNIKKKYSYFRGLRTEREASGNIKGGSLDKKQAFTLNNKRERRERKPLGTVADGHEGNNKNNNKSQQATQAKRSKSHNIKGKTLKV